MINENLFRLVEIFGFNGNASNRIPTRTKDITIIGQPIERQLYLGVLINVTKDFNPYDNKSELVLYETNSYQIRPKVLYKNKNGIYYKSDSKNIYLSKEDIEYLSKDSILSNFLK